MRDFFKELQSIGIDPDASQGTDFWHSLRLGVVTASKASCLLMKPDSGMYTTYLLENCAEICTQKKIASGSAKPLEWGNKHEAQARDAYEFTFFKPVIEAPFIYKDETRRFGCSPDGLIMGEAKGVEIKCPYTTKTHLDFIVNGEIKKEYILQCQFSMWVTDYPEWDFVSYDPRMLKKKLHIKTIKRCEETMKKFDEAAELFKQKMDEALAALDVRFGDQWGGIELPKTAKPVVTQAQATQAAFDLDQPF